MESEEKVINKECVEIVNGAEKFISVFFCILYVISVISSVGLIAFGLMEEDFSFILYSLGILLGSSLVYSFVKVLINISNNLHYINAKLITMARATPRKVCGEYMEDINEE